MSDARRAVWASLLVAAALSSVVAAVLGSVAAVVVVEVLQARRVGCVLTRIDGQDTWLCPDGIAYAAPALATVTMVWVIAMLFFVRREFRGAGGAGLACGSARSGPCRAGGRVGRHRDGTTAG